MICAVCGPAFGLDGLARCYAVAPLGAMKERVGPRGLFRKDHACGRFAQRRFELNSASGCSVIYGSAPCALALRVQGCSLASGHISIRSGAKLSVISGSFLGSKWIPLASGLRGPDRTPRGVQRPPGVSSFKGLILRCFRRVQAAVASGWLPKNPALSLAMCRASPASIRISPGRNQKSVG